jgi:hypothetical protein
MIVMYAFRCTNHKSEVSTATQNIMRQAPLLSYLWPPSRTETAMGQTKCDPCNMLQSMIEGNKEILTCHVLHDYDAPLTGSVRDAA